jgi:hypothetical protein
MSPSDNGYVLQTVPSHLGKRQLHVRECDHNACQAESKFVCFYRSYV